MKILIVYATYSSGTLEVSELILEQLKQKNHDVQLLNVAKVDPQSFNDFDLVLLGSPSWWNNDKDGQPHHLYYEFMEKTQGMIFENKQFAIFGLGDNAYARLCGAVDVLEEYVRTLQGKLFAESLRVDSFYFDKGNNEQRVKDWITHLDSLINKP